MPVLERAIELAKKDKLQAHRRTGFLYDVYNVVRGTVSIVQIIEGKYVCDCTWNLYNEVTDTNYCKHIAAIIRKRGK